MTGKAYLPIVRFLMDAASYGNVGEKWRGGILVWLRYPLAVL